MSSKVRQKRDCLKMSDLTKKIATLGDPSFIPLGSSGDHVNYAPQTVRHILKG